MSEGHEDQLEDAGVPDPTPPSAQMSDTGSGGERRGRSSRVTIREVAAASGVSQGTVSRVLNNAPSTLSVAAETRKRIEQSAERLGFKPNPFARALRGAPTMLLGVLVRDFDDPFFAAAIEAVAVEADAHGYDIVLGHIQGKDGQAARAVLAPGHCDAVIVLGEIESQPMLRTKLMEFGVPVVATWQGASPIHFPTVDVDETTGVTIGMQHLAALGHQRIAFISARLPGDNRTREQSYGAFMQECFDGIPDGYLQHCDSSLEGGAEALTALLRLETVPTAIMCSTDVAAVGALHGAHSHGVPVPDGLSVVGYDDLKFAAFTNPALTTLRMPTTEVVSKAVQSAIALARDRSMRRGPSRATYQPSLVVRESTAPPSG